MFWCPRKIIMALKIVHISKWIPKKNIPIHRKMKKNDDYYYLEEITVMMFFCPFFSVVHVFSLGCSPPNSSVEHRHLSRQQENTSEPKKYTNNNQRTYPFSNVTSTFQWTKMRCSICFYSTHFFPLCFVFKNSPSV